MQSHYQITFDDLYQLRINNMQLTTKISIPPLKITKCSFMMHFLQNHALQG